MVSRIVALGRGYIGQSFERLMGIHCYTRSEMDYTDPVKLNAIVCDADIVINCAGFTGRPHIDECEVKKGETIAANIGFPALLSRLCKDNGTGLVHLSSGCIYQGSENYAEEAAPAEKLSFYSLTKWMAEQVVEGYIVRLRMPFDGSGHPRCLLSKLDKYSRLIDCENSLTYIPDLVDATIELLRQKAPYGVYNVTNTGSATHRQISEMMGWKKQFIPVSELGTTAPRSNCTLSNEKITKYFEMPSVHERLRDCYHLRKAA